MDINPCDLTMSSFSARLNLALKPLLCDASSFLHHIWDMILGGCRTAIVYYRAMTERHADAHDGTFKMGYRGLLNGQAGIRILES